ncbi:rod shape-determining protein RodA [bacterium]|nr:rod shape-determining protein RodA [candidate division CSSED10-310 bacterium]
MFKRYLEHFDFLLLITAGVISTLGILTIYSVTGENPSPNDFQKQMLWVLSGIILSVGIQFFDYRYLKKAAPFLYLGILLILIYLVIRGQFELGVRRWIVIPGLNIRLQPSEFAKPITVLMLARWMERWGDQQPGISHLWMPVIILGLPLVLIVKQPDLGTSLMLPPILLALIFVSGFRVRTLTILMLCIMIPVFFAGKIVIKPYQMKRITSFLNPEADPQGSGYQLIQSKIAIGSGGLTGKGFKQGSQSHLDFLPVQDTDFIFAVWAEEWGFLGAVGLLCLFILLICRCIGIAKKAEDLFGRYLCIGITTIIFSQIFINIAMVIGLLPITGLPLPFMSYGGSACFTNFLSLGLVLNIGMRSFPVYNS